MLSDTLESIAQKVEGTISAMVMGLDGFVIDQYIREEREVSLEAVAAEVASLVRQTQSASTNLSFGGLEEINWRTEGFYVLTQRITDEYFLCLLLAFGGNYGRARFELRKAQSRLHAEFAI